MAYFLPSHFDELDAEAAPPSSTPEAAFADILIDPITVSLGKLIAKHLLPEEAGQLTLERMQTVRREIARETGIVHPRLRLRDDIYLGESEYCIHIGDFQVAKGTLEMDQVLAMAKPDVLEQIAGTSTKEPVYGMPAKWFDPALIADAKALGILVFDPRSVLASHIGQLIRDYLAELFTLDGYAAHLKFLATKAPVLVEVFQERVDRRIGHLAFRALLDEYVWPRDPLATLEELLQAAATTNDPRELAEVARKRLVTPMLVRRKFRSVRVGRIDMSLELEILKTLETTPSLQSTPVGINIRKAVIALSKAYTGFHVLCAPRVRRAIAELFPRFRQRVAVYATDEIPRHIRIDEVQLLTAEVIRKGIVIAPKPEKRGEFANIANIARAHESQGEVQASPEIIEPSPTATANAPTEEPVQARKTSRKKKS